MKDIHISILGGGLAGLSVGYYAAKNGMPFTIHEASDQIGGNSVTFKHGDFLFDSGAHRFHDKDDEITGEVKDLAGKDLKRINIPSRIYHNGKYIDFPLSPLNLMGNLGLPTIARAAGEVIVSKIKDRSKFRNFGDFATRTYGNTIASLFLLNYSEKLWGKPCSELSVQIAGKRLKGLDVRAFFKEAVFRRDVKADHVEGSFYYPTEGIGTIAKKMAEFCGEGNIIRNSHISRIIHDRSRIEAIEVNGKELIRTKEVVSTLPLNTFLRLMDPLPSEEIMQCSKGLHFRNVILVALFLNRETVTSCATVYFPSLEFPFTRVYEPKNRSVRMSPPGKTSLVAEIPCQPEDTLWGADDNQLTGLIRSHLIRIGWIKEEEIIDSVVKRMRYGYPILETGTEEKVRRIYDYLQNFSNLKVSGRNGKFVYAWIHNMMRLGKEIISDYL
jgi:protoporphyrinogen oxidase